MSSKDLNKMKKDELLDLARSKGLKVVTRMKKAEIIDVIKKGSPRISGARKSKAGKKTASVKAKTRKPSGRTSAPEKILKKRTKKGGRKVTTKKSRTTGAPKSSPAPKRRDRETETIRQRAVSGKYYLGETEEVTPPVDTTELPEDYGITRIAAMVRDPHWIFTYWEITPESYQELRQSFGKQWPECKMILRVYSAGGDTEKYSDITIVEGARNWYIRVSPEGQYRVAIGAINKEGNFREIATSNTVETPRAWISDEIDELWMAPDDFFERVVTASGGYDPAHSSSAELGEAMRKHLAAGISSGGVSSFGSGALRKPELERAFRLRVATELILYGATEPDARVTVKGEEIELRSDGTFSLRFALPNGKLDLPVTAVSADGREERSVDTEVSKTSHIKEPVKK
jgi:hypothetical protein